MISKYLMAWFLVICLAGCSGISTGRLYTNVIRPYSRDFNHTPVGSKQCIIKDYKIKEPVSGYGVSVEWSKGQIQSAAREAGIENIAYVDVQTISFLLGIYTRKKLIIYGD